MRIGSLFPDLRQVARPLLAGSRPCRLHCQQKERRPPQSSLQVDEMPLGKSVQVLPGHDVLRN